MTLEQKIEMHRLEEVKMKACPFCGDIRRLDSAETIDSKLVESHWIYCHKCGSSGPTMPTLKDAINRWNQRL